MAITRLALANPSANIDTSLYTSARNILVSVIATNKSATTAATVRIWVVPSGATLPSQYSYVSYDAVLPVSNSLETFRFPIVSGDVVHVQASTDNVSFLLSGIYETNGTSNITAASVAPTNPIVGDVWVNTSTSAVLYWNGTAWASGTADTSTYPFSKYQSSAPTATATGQIWIDSDDAKTYVWTGSQWLVTTSPGSSYQSSAPSNPTTGQLWVDSDNGETFVYNGSAWTSTINPFVVNKVTGDGITNIVALTQAQYDALSPKSATTLYVVT